MAKKDEKEWWINRQGAAVHPDMVKVNDKIKDEMVEKLLNQAGEVSEVIAAFKKKANDEVDAYFALLLQNYGIDEKSKSKKGNLSLENFSATAKVEIRISETLAFDERLQVAKLKVDEYLNDVTKDSIPEIRVLISKAFEVDKEGKVDAKKIFALKAYEITDPRWVQAMEIIDEAKQVSHTKPYIRFYTRASVDEKYELVPLDIAGV
jgi:hypothetical protein